jgi:hypothetical protein
VTPTGIENGPKVAEAQGFHKDSDTNGERGVGENRSNLDFADKTLTARVSALDLVDDLRRVAEIIRSGRIDLIDPVERSRLAAAAESASVAINDMSRLSVAALPTRVRK